ncbi:MAG TPA: hypothetical protein VMC08_03195, partial [Bacteroidales bacterium]|nr:hypothetical protein [Bacteroidales bacterium]
MVTSSILNIAITLVFIYLVLAIMITGLNEMIFTFTRKRAQYLERAIDHLFFDGEWKEIAGKVKDSPFINSLKKARNIFPAYIPASNFAKAVLTSFGTGSYSVEAIREYLASTPPKGEFSRMMAALVQKEDLKIEELEQEIEELYNNSMDRLSA